MTTFIFNKNTETEMVIPVTSVWERTLDGVMGGSFAFEPTSETELPEIKTREIETMEVVDGDTPIPIMGTYNVIKDFSTNYFDKEKVFTYSITIGFEG